MPACSLLSDEPIRISVVQFVQKGNIEVFSKMLHVMVRVPRTRQVGMFPNVNIIDAVYGLSTCDCELLLVQIAQNGIANIS